MLLNKTVLFNWFMSLIKTSTPILKLKSNLFYSLPINKIPKKSLQNYYNRSDPPFCFTSFAMHLKLPGLLLLFTTTLHGIIHDFPARENWVNSVDSVEKLELFVHSTTAFAREVVTIVQEEGQQKQPCLGGKYPLIQGLHRLELLRKDHQIMLVFNTPGDYKDSVKSLTTMRHKWIWLFFPIEQGPFNEAQPIAMNEFSAEELRLMQHFQLAFGFTSDKQFGRGEYLRNRMDSLAGKTDLWYTKLQYGTNFIVELSMHVLLNTSDHARVLRPFLDRTMFISLVTSSRDEKLILRHKGEMKALARMLGRQRVYLNIPDKLKALLNPEKWFGESESRGGALEEVRLVLLFLGGMLVFMNNKRT